MRSLSQGGGGGVADVTLQFPHKLASRGVPYFMITLQRPYFQVFEKETDKEVTTIRLLK